MHLNYDILNEFPFQLALIDHDGIVLFTNHAWNHFGAENGSTLKSWVGLSYLNTCNNAVGVERTQANSIQSGLQKVLDGQTTLYEEVYPCHSLTEHRWFKLIANATPFGAIVSHINLSKEAASKMPIGAKDGMADIIHDLRSPVSGIVSLVSLIKLQMKKPSPDTEKISKSLERINSVGADLLDHISELLPAAQGITKKEVEEINFSSVIQHTIENLSSLIDERNINLQYDLDQEITIQSTNTGLRSLITNLVSNAVKYNKDNGQIEVSLKKNLSQGVVLSVTDSGLGIPEDKLDTVFNQFERVEEHEDTAVGSGVGLSSVQRFMHEMDGTIEVTSKVNQGSCFTATFPGWRTITAA